MTRRQRNLLLPVITRQNLATQRLDALVLMTSILDSTETSINTAGVY